MPWVALAAAGAAIIGGAMASDSSSDDRDAAIQQNKEAVKAWLDVNIPDPELQKVTLQRFVLTGKLDPKLEQAIQRDASAFEKIQVDPRLKQSQLKALSSLEDIGSSGGLTLSDKANLQRGLNDINVADRGRREAIADNMQRRGISGSGLEMSAQLRNQQDATNRQSDQQLQTLGSARDRALQAIMQSGNLAGSMSEQDYSQQKDLAGARDSIADFNARAMQGVQSRNVGYQNDAQAANVRAAQDVANANTGIANQQEIQNKSVYQQDFTNRATRAAGMTGQYQSLGNAYDRAADRTAGTWAGVGQGVSNGITSAYNNNALNEYLDKQEKEKEKSGDKKMGIF